MPVLTATNLKHAYGEDIILDGCSLSIEPGERIGIVGRNGEGKSTLLKALVGVLVADSGEVSLAKGSRVGYLSQDPKLDPDDTLKDCAERAFEELHALHDELKQIYDDMGHAEGDALDKLLARQVEVEEKIERAGGYAIEHKIDATLHGLGFTDAQFDVKVGGLSGGQKARAGLARLLLEGPDVLLLDEPTNHLDIEGRIWLETFLRDEYKGAVVLISHDRYLLDRVVHRIVEVERGRLIDYPGNYRAFREQRADRILTQQRAWEKQQTAFKREEAFIRKYKAGQRAKQAKGRESRLDRAKAETTLEKPMELDALRLEMPKAERTGELVVVARDLSKKYRNDDGTDKVLFHDLTMTIGRGERWGIIGPNGAGKTTLVRCLLGEQPVDRGTVKPGSKLRIGHFTQTHEGLPMDLNVYRYLQWAVRKQNEKEGIPESQASMLSEQGARNLAGAFLFSGRDQEKDLLVLSGGERSRAVLAGLLASAKNVMVLDEPTNHLDIPSAERLEAALKSPANGGVFEGTMILISHDRALIDGTCTHLLVLDGKGGSEIFAGNYTEYRAFVARREGLAASAVSKPTRATIAVGAGAAKAESRSVARSEPKPAPRSNPQLAHRPAANPAPKPAQKPAPKDSPKDGGKSKYSWMAIGKIESRLAELESLLADIDKTLNDPDVWREPAKANQLTDRRDALNDEKQQLEAEWLRKSG